MTRQYYTSQCSGVTYNFCAEVLACIYVRSLNAYPHSRVFWQT